MGRHKEYPDAENTIAAFYAAVSDSYRNPTSDEIGDFSGRKKQELLAEEFVISRLKVRIRMILLVLMLPGPQMLFALVNSFYINCCEVGNHD